MRSFRTRPAAHLPVSLLICGLLLIPGLKTAYAEQFLFLKSENIKTAAIQPAPPSTSAVGFDSRGNLAVRNGNLAVVLICNPPGSEPEHYSVKTPVMMARNHDLPEMQGYGVMVTLSF